MKYTTFIPTVENFEAMLNKGLFAVVFADEGTATKTGLNKDYGLEEVVTWKFNEEHTKAGAMGIDFEPLLIDAMTQNIISKVLEKVKPETKERIIRQAVQNRAYYAIMIETVWRCVN